MTTPRLRMLTTAGLTALLVAATGFAGAGPASAAPLDRGRFVDHIDEEFDCSGTPTTNVGDVTVAFTVVQRRGAPYYRESVEGHQVFTNLDTGGTYSTSYTANGRDMSITDNGDGTVTIVSQVSGVSRWYDTDGTLVLMDSGVFRFSVVIDLNGTPDNPDDDVEVDGSFDLFVPRTGRTDTDGRDFCDDLREFTA
jgi:hypothetical protein